MDIAQKYEESCQLLAAGHNAEFGGLLDRIDGVAAGIGKPDDLRLGGLSLQQERREILGVERSVDRAKHLAARRLDGIAGIALQSMAEGVVGGDEKPGVSALFDQGAAGAVGKRVGVVGPVDAVG